MNDFRDDDNAIQASSSSQPRKLISFNFSVSSPALSTSSIKAIAVSAALVSSKASKGAALALKPETSGVPVVPAQVTNGSTIKKGSSTTDNIPTKAAAATPTTPKKADTVKDKKGTFRGHFKGDSEAATGDISIGSVDGSCKKLSFFGKIKYALSPHSSPSK
ncbi:uncharacterized protein FA14DRAFT_173169 [Meira miltonrushii]|uniref:Uncharacterized protein n=1 Tax=Meira miltonrushii TaxID=1280837 RepID=A0A316V7E0_9BASI|nr:uncharacterized protein FA14DRAFT_173169 [Meira miltonrushii]PWN33362.1 hypothetical protein FA14DRAFT_173169 [Meira miltonrushii]